MREILPYIQKEGIILDEIRNMAVKGFLLMRVGYRPHISRSILMVAMAKKTQMHAVVRPVNICEQMVV